MPELVLTEEQRQVAAQALGPLPVRDGRGQIMGHFEPKLTPELIAELKRRARAPGPRYTSPQVSARLRALQEEWDRRGGFDEAYMREYLRRLNQDDPPHMEP